MAKAPPPARTTKGAPPSTIQVVNNLTKPEPGKLKPLNFKVSPEFHREFKTYAANHGVSMTALLYDAFNKLQEVQG